MYCKPDERLKPEHVNAKPHVKPTIKKMVWGGVWREGRTPLVFMQRDPDSRCFGFTSRSYIWALEEGLLHIYERDRSFIQDNATIHKSRASLNWLSQHNISLIDWPTHSPDLNPIENCWAWMKAYLGKKYPELITLGPNQRDEALFEERITEAWEAIPQEVIRNTIESIPERCHMVQNAKGWYI